MKDRFINQADINGYVFDYDLEKKITGAQSKNPNTEYIRGNVQIATDEDAVNVVKVSFTYVTPTRRDGKSNENYETLEAIMKSDKTLNKGASTDEVMKVRIRCDLASNDFMGKDGQLVEAKDVVGRFVHFYKPNETVSFSSAFEAEAFIQSAAMRESDSGDYMELKGFVFRYNGSCIFPVTFSVPGEQGQAFFEGQDISSSEPYFGKVWGHIKTTVQKVEREVDESEVGFGSAPAVGFSTRTFRSWDVEGANINLGADNEEVITMDDMKRLAKERAETVANVRKRWEESQNKSTGFGSAPTPAPKPKKAAPKVTKAPEFEDGDDEDFPF